MPEVDFDVNVTALYEAIGKSDWDAASQACRANPIESETWVVRRDRQDGSNADGGGGNGNDNILWRFLPLHSACARRPPASFVRDLLDAYPEAARLPDESGMFPLHYACGNRASKAVIRLLVDSFPGAVREADPSGMLPLHYIAQWGPIEVGCVKLLLEEYPEGITKLNGDSMSPMDLCREGNFGDWEEILDMMDEFIKTKRKGGELGTPDAGVPREIEKKERKSSTRASPRSRKERPSSRSRMRSSSRERSEKQTRSYNDLTSSRHERDVKPSYSYSHVETAQSRKKTPSFGSRRSELERVEVAHTEARDESSTPRSRYEGRSIPRHDPATTPRNKESFDSSARSSSFSVSCSLASPRYHEMKTPRSSGRGPRGGPGFNFSPTPRSASPVIYEDEPTIPSQQTESQRSGYSYDHDQQLAHPLSNETDTVEVLENENVDLRAKLAIYEEENAKLRDKLAHLQNSLAIAEERDISRSHASNERKRIIMELLAMEEKAR